MRIAVVDDEPSLIKLASHTIKSYGNEKNITIDTDEFLSGELFLESYVPGTYDIIFMDVYMPEMTGVDTIIKLREADPNVPVIFLTTSESHMKDALSCHAFDYLIKPATRTAFFKVLDDCISMLGDKVFSESKYISFRSKGLDISVPASDIVSVSSNGHFVVITMQDNTEYTVKENFSSISDTLSECQNMLQINRGILINMDFVLRFDDTDCYLKNGLRYSVKIKTCKAIRQAYEDYIRSR